MIRLSYIWSICEQRFLFSSFQTGTHCTYNLKISFSVVNQPPDPFSAHWIKTQKRSNWNSLQILSRLTESVRSYFLRILKQSAITFSAHWISTQIFSPNTETVHKYFLHMHTESAHRYFLCILNQQYAQNQSGRCFLCALNKHAKDFSFCIIIHKLSESVCREFLCTLNQSADTLSRQWIPM